MTNDTPEVVEDNVNAATVFSVMIVTEPVLLIEVIDTVEVVNPDAVDVTVAPTTIYGLVMLLTADVEVPGLESNVTVVELEEYVPSKITG